MIVRTILVMTLSATLVLRTQDSMSASRGGESAAATGGPKNGKGCAPLLDRDEFRIISSIWPEYFPDEVR